MSDESKVEKTYYVETGCQDHDNTGFGMNINWERIASNAYQAYAEEVDYINHCGEEMPEFADLPEKTKRAWAEAVIASYNAFAGCFKNVIDLAEESHTELRWNEEKERRQRKYGRRKDHGDGKMENHRS